MLANHLPEVQVVILHPLLDPEVLHANVSQFPQALPLGNPNRRTGVGVHCRVEVVSKVFGHGHEAQ